MGGMTAAGANHAAHIVVIAALGKPYPHPQPVISWFMTTVTRVE